MEIGAFEAKTRLSELLRETEKGAEFIISKRGKPVARLLPYHTGSEDMSDRVAQFDAVRNEIAGPIDLKALIEEGRR